MRRRTSFTGFGVIFPVALMLVGLPFCPESPNQLLLARGDEKGAKRALERLRGHNQVAGELKQLRIDAEKRRSTPSVGATYV